MISEMDSITLDDNNAAIFCRYSLDSGTTMRSMIHGVTRSGLVLTVGTVSRYTKMRHAVGY